MKINKAKIMVTTLAIAAVAATVGSISGTVAWFQYSTRVTAAYQGAVAHCSESLEIRIRSEDDTLGAWKSELSAAAIDAYLSAATADKGAGRTTATNTLRPVTSGVLAENEVASTLYKNPIYQYPNMTDWGTATATEDYIILPLELRVKDVNGAASGSETYLAKKIYITDLDILARADHTGYVKDDHEDVSSAIRVGVSAGQAGAAKTAYTTFSTTGTDTVVAGALDLGGPAGPDKGAGYSEWDELTEIQYGYSGTGSYVAKSTINTQLATTATATTVGVANDVKPYEIKGKEIGSTTAGNTLEVDLLIYLEGWTKFGTGTDASAVWNDETFVGAEFNVGIRFSADAHNATGE